MFQRQGRILKRGMEIRLTGVPGITGFGKEAEICQTVPPDQIDFLLKGLSPGPMIDGTMNQGQA
jgi:hypothetical protein